MSGNLHGGVRCPAARPGHAVDRHAFVAGDVRAGLGPLLVDDTLGQVGLSRPLLDPG